MKQIAIISGKGGTGKTIITAALAYLAENKILADCDVDAPDLHLLLKPEEEKTFPFIAGKIYKITEGLCNTCGICKEKCRFEAISDDFVIDTIACEGCGACYFLCPKQAVISFDNKVGEYYISKTRYGKMVHARLYPGEENSGKLVAQVRKEATEIAGINKVAYIIIDGPPGIGCPVNAAITGVDLVLVVTEPTLSGIHDLRRVLDLATHFNIEAKVVINKYDINLDNTEQIETICKEKQVDCVGKILYLKEVVEALVQGKVINEYNPKSEVSKIIENIWDKIR